MNIDPSLVIDELQEQIKSLSYQVAVQSAAIKQLQAQVPVVDSPAEG